ncbi:hypothetical protein HGRIS_008118 [Hohenbuehelia grisea]|uniref:Uncharacterized protein n=1 Tax=Hohenbuehelia grisea TaxID=104357 RepID=A0ABR3J7D3_9AGAR
MVHQLGSTYIYTAYLQPFLKKNEADLDAGIIAAQQSTLTFLQTRLSSLWDFFWSLINKTPASGQPPAPGAPPQAGAGAGLSLESAMGLWRSYGPSVLGALQPGTRAASNAPAPSTPGARPAAAASSSSIQVPTAERRGPLTPESEPLPNPYGISPSATPGISTPSSNTPSFPEPQFH